MIGIISIGARSTEVGFFDKGVLTFPSPPIGIAGTNLTTEISQAMGMIGEQAEALKKEYAAVDIEGFGALYGSDEPTTYDTYGAPGLPYETPFDKELPNNYSGSSEASETTGYDVDETGGPRFDMGGETAEAPEGNEPAQAAPAFDLDSDEPAAPAQSADVDQRTQASGTTVVPSTSQAKAEGELGGPVFDMSEIGAAPDVSYGAPGHVASDRQEMSGQVFRSIANVLVDLAREVRTSLEYYYTRYQKMPARIYLCGGTSKIPKLDEFLSRELGVPVQVADPLKGVRHSVPGMSESQMRELAPLFCVSIGLAVRDMVE